MTDDIECNETQEDLRKTLKQIALDSLKDFDWHENMRRKIRDYIEITGAKEIGDGMKDLLAEGLETIPQTVRAQVIEEIVRKMGCVSPYLITEDDTTPKIDTSTCVDE